MSTHVSVYTGKTPVLPEQNPQSACLFVQSIYTKKEVVSKENPGILAEISSILNSSPISCNWVVRSAIFLGLENLHNI